MNVIQIEFWQMMGMLGTALIVLIGAGWALATIIVNQFTTRLDERHEAQELRLTERERAQDELRKQRERSLDDRFTALEKSIREEGDGWRKVERELLHLKAELPVQYTRREDQIRQEMTINSKLDALAKKIDELRSGG